jgi:microcystin-dependent protein
MPYNLRNFDGRAFTTIADGVVDQQLTSSLNLVGKDVVSYGTYQNDNFLWLLENFSGTIEPVNKIQGQIWFDKNTNVMKPKIYDGFQWKSFAMNYVQESEPQRTVEGDLWFNTETEQLFAKGTSDYVLIGPQKIPGYGVTNWDSTLVQDTALELHPSIIAYVNGEIVGVISTDSYDVNSSEAVFQSGITKMGKGVNLIPGGRVLGDFQYTEGYNDEIITGDWAFETGLAIGNFSLVPTASDLTFDVDGNNLKINASAILPVGASTLGNSSNKFTKIFVNEINAGSSITGINLIGQYSLNSGSKFFPATDNSISLGAANARWSSIFSSALSAGGSSNQAQLVGDWRLEANSTLDLTAGTFKADSISSGGSTIPGSLTGNWSVSPGSVFNVIGSTFSANIISNSLGTLDVDVLDVSSLKVKGNVVLNSANYNNYAPSKIGAGASGTWNINISGNSETLGTKPASYFASVDSPNLTGAPTAPTASPGTSNSQIATTAFVQASLSSSLPRGSVIMWYGSIETIPGGWALCDGRNVSGFLTPDLRDRFIVGAGSSYNLGATGGQSSVTLTSDQVPVHSHSGTTGNQSANHTHAVSLSTSPSGDHHHIFPGDDQLAFANGRAGWAAISDADFPYDARSQVSGGAKMWRTSTAGSHSHTFNGTTDGVSQNHTHAFTTNSVGGGQPHENRPPFYALYYIIKVV